MGIKKWDSQADWETYESKNIYLTIADNKLSAWYGHTGWGIWDYDSGKSGREWKVARMSGDCGAPPPGIGQSNEIHIEVCTAETEVDLDLWANVRSFRYCSVGGKGGGGDTEFPADLTGMTGRWIRVKIFVKYGVVT